MSDDENTSCGDTENRAVGFDLVCPITLELPFNPVIAEDGRIYERAAIQEHFEHGNHRSPLTNEPMGTRLIPSPQIKAHIENLIDSNAIKGDLKKSWLAKVAKKKQVDALIKKASEGDPKASYKVHRYYRDGDHGFEQNSALAYKWLNKAREGGSTKAYVCFGEALLVGKVGTYNIRKSRVEGIMYLALAAEKGSNRAALKLGFAYAEGKYGFLVDKRQAVEWFRRGLSPDCPCQHAKDSFIEEAEKKLAELVEAEDTEDEDSESIL